MALTVKRVERLVARGERCKVLDGDGLYLVIGGPNAAHWERRYQIPGAAPPPGKRYRPERNGKTTTIKMLIMAVTGMHAAAAAWSSNEEERRKALMSYFLAGVPYILWDNIPRGTQISCPHIEKSCTSALYSDRRLGVTELVATAATSIHHFTGNGIAPKGDLASRSLIIELDTARHDPENREFKHPDPIGWTEDHRAEILRALYMILFGNPTLDEPRDASMRTRFKMWWRLIGSAVEHAAKQAGHEVDFRTFIQHTGGRGRG